MNDIMGYKVKKIENCKYGAYLLTGKRGGTKMLVRYVDDPELMYVIDKNGVITNICGNYTWTDKGGELTPAYNVV